jgi:hypothetical protein
VTEEGRQTVYENKHDEPYELSSECLGPEYIIERR